MDRDKNESFDRFGVVRELTGETDCAGSGEAWEPSRMDNDGAFPRGQVRHP